MKKIVEFVNLSFKNSQEYFKQTIEIQHIKADFIATLLDDQKQKFEQLFDKIYKLHRLDNEEYIIHTYKVCKEIFKLR